MAEFHTRLDWATALAANKDNLLEDEFQAERASALGSAGRRLERAMAAWRASGKDQAALDEASRVAWEFMVMRETAGLRDWPSVVRLYAIPPEVLRRMGAAPTKGQP